MNDPMRERREALDLAIVILDAERLRLSHLKMRSKETKIIRDIRIDNVNHAIQILTAMKDEGPLL